MFNFRLVDHRGYVSNRETTQATGNHFNLPGHILADLQVTCIERIRKNNIMYRKTREDYHIAIHQGINRIKLKNGHGKVIVHI